MAMDQQKDEKLAITKRTTTKTKRRLAPLDATFAAIALLVIAIPLAMMSSTATPVYGKVVIL